MRSATDASKSPVTLATHIGQTKINHTAPPAIKPAQQSFDQFLENSQYYREHLARLDDNIRKFENKKKMAERHFQSVRPRVVVNGRYEKAAIDKWNYASKELFDMTEILNQYQQARIGTISRAQKEYQDSLN